jgi:aspartate dehydrogenase
MRVETVDAVPHELRVGIIGYGALGSTLSKLIDDLQDSALRVTAVMDRRGIDRPVPVEDIEMLIQRSDVVVEAAGPAALRQHAQTVLGSGRTLVAASVGAFLQEDLWRLLGNDRPGGRLILSTGALGGLDLLRATKLADPSVAVRLKSRTRPRPLIQPWMDRDTTQRLALMGPNDAPVTVYSGQAREAARLFPANLNVAAALAIAIGDPDRVAVDLTADSRAKLTTHQIEITSTLGESTFVIQNTPLDSNPATSAVVPWALLRCLRELARSSTFYFA